MVALVQQIKDARLRSHFALERKYDAIPNQTLQPLINLRLRQFPPAEQPVLLSRVFFGATQWAREVSI